MGRNGTKGPPLQNRTETLRVTMQNRTETLRVTLLFFAFRILLTIYLGAIWSPIVQFH